MSNHIQNLQDELVAANAENLALIDGMRDLMVYLTSSKFSTDQSVNVRDVLVRLSETWSAAQEARDAALSNELGPKPEPSTKGWICPICRETLQDSPIWNDTDAKAEQRMRNHWTANHKAR